MEEKAFSFEFMPLPNGEMAAEIAQLVQQSMVLAHVLAIAGNGDRQNIISIGRLN